MNGTTEAEDYHDKTSEQDCRYDKASEHREQGRVYETARTNHAHDADGSRP
jgi:hypothetical protein